MLPDRVSNPGPLTYESGALPIALCGPATIGKPTSKQYMIITEEKVVQKAANQCLATRNGFGYVTPKIFIFKHL